MKAIFEPLYLYYNESFQENKCVVIENNIIIDVGENVDIKKRYSDAQINCWKDLIMIPGTVNIHNHSFQSLLRGIACDRAFLEWRDEALYKYSERLSKEDIYNGALFAFSEMMKCGVTTVCDFFYLHNYGVESDEMIIKAAQDAGIRLVLARTMYDWDGAPRGYVESIETAVENTKKLFWKYKNDDMVSILPAPHSLHAASVEMVKAGHQLAKELGIRFHIHVAEEPFEVEQIMAEYDGMTPIELLDKIGVVDSSMVMVHGVWLKESEMKLLGERKANLAYCPSSNMFLADGITNLPLLVNAGVMVGLGSDGACSNNRISVFEEMRMASLLQKVHNLDAMCLNYKDVFKMGTEDGGKILQMPIGKIEIGYKADFVGIQTKHMCMQPISESKEQILPNIVYSMQPEAIEKVVVDGKITLDKGILKTVPEDAIVEKVQETMRRIEG